MEPDRLAIHPIGRPTRLPDGLIFAGDMERPAGARVSQDKVHGKPSTSAPKATPERRCQIRDDDGDRPGLLCSSVGG